METDKKARNTLQETLQETLNAHVQSAKSILLCTHRKPDGDGIGCMLALQSLFRAMGRDVVTYCPDGIPRSLQFLPGALESVDHLSPDTVFDLTILLDTSDPDKLPDGFPEEKGRGVLAVVDHHMEETTPLGDLRIQQSAAAVGEIIYDMAVAFDWPLNQDSAQCLYASVVADTSAFRYGSTTPRSHQIAAALHRLGATPVETGFHLFGDHPLSTQLLTSDLLSTLAVDGPFASIYCTLETLTKRGANADDLSGMINMARAIDGVEVAALFREETSGVVRVSLRSKGRVDISSFLDDFGGGGTANAAGCRFDDRSMGDAIAVVKMTVLDKL